MVRRRDSHERYVLVLERGTVNGLHLFLALVGYVVLYIVGVYVNDWRERRKP